MKNLVKTLLFLSLLLSGHLLLAQNSELDSAVARLWTTGPDEKIEQVLKAQSENANPAVAAKARLHLACLQVLSNSENAAEVLAQLEKSAQNDADKETVNNLKQLLQTRASKLPESFQQRITLDFNQTDIRAIVKIIAAQSSTNIVLHSKINKQVSIRLVDASIAQALDTLCAVADMRYENRNGVFILLPISGEPPLLTQKFYMLQSLSPAKAIQMLKAQANHGTEMGAPGNFADSGASAKTADGLPEDLTIKAGFNSVTLEGKPETVKKYRDILERLDLKDKAHKISMRIWQLNPDKTLDIKAFSELDEKERGKVARIISAPAIIALPGKSSKIEVDSGANPKTEPPAEALDYSIACNFQETQDPDQLSFSAEIAVYGTSVVNGQTLKNNKSYATRIKIKRNAWAMLPFYQGDSLLYLEVQLTSKTD